MAWEYLGTQQQLLQALEEGPHSDRASTLDPETGMGNLAAREFGRYHLLWMTKAVSKPSQVSRLRWLRCS